MNASKLHYNAYEKSLRLQVLADKYCNFKVTRYKKEKDAKLQEARAVGKSLYRINDEWVIK